MNSGAVSPISFKYYFAPLLHLSKGISAELPQIVANVIASSPFDCDTNFEKAERIAKNLVSDWQIAKYLVELHNGKFIGILQPVVYFSQTRRDHLRDENIPRFKSQFEAVYPLIQRRLITVDGLHDMTAALDGDDYYYIDFCHISPNGNARIARRIAELIESPR